MNLKNSTLNRTVLLLLVFATFQVRLSPAFAQGTTAFTYHGRLTDNVGPVSGNYLFYFAVFPTNFGGSLLSSTTNSVPVSNGLFRVALDFGAAIFDGAPRWLELGVSTNGPAAFVTLQPRQQILPTPYAIMAGTAAAVSGGAIYSGNIAAGQLVRSLNGLRDDVALMAGANITLTPGSNNNIFISANGGSGVFSLNGTNAYYNSGNVGIGTASPDRRLNIYDGDLALGGSSSPWGTTALLFNGNYATPNAGRIRFGDGTGWKFHFQRRVDNTDLVTVRDDGNVGIGTSSPTAKLDVRPIAFADNQSGGIQLATTDGHYLSGMFLRTDAAGIPRLAFDIASSEVLNINNIAGNVGIGTTYPTAPLEVRRSSQASVRIVSDNTANGSVLELWNTTSPSGHCGPDTPNQLNYGAITFGNGVSTPGQITYEACNDNMSFRVGGSALVYFEPTGVGIGRHASANRFEVEGNASKTTAGSWLANSDARIKYDTQSLTNACDKLNQVRLVSFRYTEEYRKAHPGIEAHPYFNVIAQEFKKAFPDWVKGSGEQWENGDEILQVDTYPLTIYSAAAVQELHRQAMAKEKEITQLREEIAIQRSVASRLEARLKELERFVDAHVKSQNNFGVNQQLQEEQ